MFKNILIVFFILTTAWFAWISLTIKVDPIERTFEQYNHMKIWEDGSFEGEDRNGEKVQGCITGGLCKD